MFDRKGTETSVVKLVRQTCRLDVASKQPNELSGLIARTVLYPPVVVSGLPVLRILELDAKLIVKTCKACSKVRSCGDRGFVDETGFERRVMSVGREERRLAGRFVRVIVERELGDGQVIDPVVLLVGGIGAKVGLERLVGTLLETVGLRVVGSRVFEFDLKQRGKFFPKMRNKHRSAVRNDGVWKAVVAEDAVEEEPSQLGSRHSFLTGNEVRIARQAVADDEDRVVAMRRQ